MADHFHVRTKDDIVEFDNVAYVTELEIPLYLFGDNVYAGLYMKAVSGTVYIKLTITDSASATASDTKNTALTTYQAYTVSNKLDIDCSGLTEGSATLKIEVKGDGAFKDMYVWQE